MLDLMLYSESEIVAVAAILKGDLYVVTELSSLVKPDDFYSEQLGIAFRVICDLRAKNIPVPPATVREELTIAFRNDPRIDDKLSHTLAERTAEALRKCVGAESIVTALHHAKRVVAAARVRSVYQWHSNIAGSLEKYEFSSEGDFGANDLVTMVQTQAMALSPEIAKGRKETRLSELLDAHYEELVAQYEKPRTEIRGLKTGFPTLDYKTEGLCPGDFILIGGETGGGKTAFALELARNSARLSNASWHIFSYEMGHQKLINRWVFAEAKVDRNRFKSKSLDDREWERIRSAYRRLGNLPPQFLHTDSNLTLSDIGMICRQAKHRREFSGAIVDYIQLMPNDGAKSAERRDLEVAAISRGLKSLGMELDAPFIGLTQLNDKGDVRESKAIKHDADIFMVPQLEEGGEEDEFRRCKLALMKVRDQAKSDVNLLFWGGQTRFGEEEEHYGIY